MGYGAQYGTGFDAPINYVTARIAEKNAEAEATKQDGTSTATQEESKQSTAVSRSAVKSQQGQTARNTAMSGSILTSPVQSSANQGQKTLLGQ